MPIVVIEGVDGSGKTTQVEALGAFLRDRYHFTVHSFREPGQTPLGEAVRKLLFSSDDRAEWPKSAELFLFLAARASLCHHIRSIQQEDPKAWIILDRFWPSTFAYQIWGNELDWDTVEDANALAAEDVDTDVMFYLDIDLDRALGRTGKDPFTSRDRGYYDRVLSAYQFLCREGVLIPIQADGPDRSTEMVTLAMIQVLDSEGLLCSECGSTGGIDSGGTTPDGKWINLPCPSCQQRFLQG